MEINIYINTKRISANIKAAIDEYIKRLSPYCRLNIICSTKLPDISNKPNTYHAYITNPNYTNPTISSTQYAKLINEMMSGGTSKIFYYIGYTANDAPSINYFPIVTPSMSNELTAVSLSEQIYRAFTIINNIAYHK